MTIDAAPITPARWPRTLRWNEQLACCERERPRINGLPDSGQQAVADPGDAAADHDQRGVQEVDDGRQHCTDQCPGLGEQGERGEVAALSRMGRVGCGERARLRQDFSEHVGPPLARECFGTFRDCTTAGERFETSNPAASADDRWVVRHSNMADIPRRALGTANESAILEDAGSDAGGDFYDDNVLMVARDAGARLAERHRVDVVVDPYRRVVALRQHLAHTG
jgi:hypothetical protein